ncbi:MAG: DUF2723 domain-containing protein [Deltaproteobacteria bacterium]|nr:DUF2723 domain-containing protein [Deltaproteobacteria bacterium]
MMAVLVFTAAFILYIVTLSPTISVGDSPELISSAYTLGIAHPPGYPLSSLIGKAVTLISFGDSVAYRVNLLSAFLGGISVLFLYLTILEAIRLVRMGSRGLHSTPSTVDRLSAFLGSLSFAVSPLFWSQAVIAEVYTLNAAFFTCLLWLGLKWAGKCQWSGGYGSRLLYLISFLWGLSLGNHHTMIAFGPAFLVFVLLKKGKGEGAGRSKGKGKEKPLPAFTVAVAITFFLLGLSIYLYLPIRSAQDPFMDWGDTERLSGFLDVLLRRQFGLGNRAYSMEGGLMQGGYYLSLLREQFTLSGLILGVIGGLFFVKRSPKASLFTLALFLVHGIATALFLNPAREDLYAIDVMLIPSFAAFSVWIGIGLLFVYSGVISLFTKNLTTGREKKICLALTLIFLLLPLTLFSVNFNTNNQSSNTFAYDYANDVTESVDPNGVLFVEADLSLFPIWYMQYVEGVRKDVAVLDVDMLMLPWFKGQLKEKYPAVEVKVPDIIRHAKGGRFKPLSMEAMVSYKVSQVEGMLDNLMGKHPLYLSYEFGVPFGEFGERRDVRLVRNGVVFMVSREKASDEPMGDFSGLRSIVKAVESRDEEVLFIARAYVQSMERMVSLELSSGRKDQAMEIMEAILTVDPYNTDSLNNLAFLYAEEEKNFYKAEQMAKRAMRINPVERGRYLKTLGFIYLKKGEYGKAIEVFKEVLKIEPGSEWARLRLEEAYSKISPPLAGGD